MGRVRLAADGDRAVAGAGQSAGAVHDLLQPWARSANFAHQTMWMGDCLDVMRGMDSDCVNLIYLDLPFNGNADYAAPREHFQMRHLPVDHITSVSKGGTDHISNLQLLCGTVQLAQGRQVASGAARPADRQRLDQAAEGRMETTSSEELWLSSRLRQVISLPRSTGGL